MRSDKYACQLDNPNNPELIREPTILELIQQIHERNFVFKCHSLFVKEKLSTKEVAEERLPGYNFDVEIIPKDHASLHWQRISPPYMPRYIARGTNFEDTFKRAFERFNKFEK